MKLFFHLRNKIFQVYNNYTTALNDANYCFIHKHIIDKNARITSVKKYYF